MRRRSFLLGSTALAATAAVAKALPLPPVPRVLPILRGDGIHDDAPAIQAMIDSGYSPVRIDWSPVLRSALTVPPGVTVCFDAPVHLAGDGAIVTPA